MRRNDGDRVQGVAAGLRVLSHLLFDEPLDAVGVCGVSALCELFAEELERIDIGPLEGR